ATVRLIAPGGGVLTAVEDSKTSPQGRGAGSYRFALTGASLQAGGTYRLVIATAQAETVTAETTIPNTPTENTTTTRSFNRARDTAVVTWAKTNARTYFVRIESPYGPFFIFTDSASLKLS